MLGGLLRADYRGGLNFLSRGDYAPWARHYNRNQVQPISRRHANPYDPMRTNDYNF